MKYLIAILTIIVSLLTAYPTLGAEDITEVTPPRLGPALGFANAPLSVGYRMTMGEHYSFDLLAHIPVIVTMEDELSGYDLSGLEFGGLLGYTIPLRLEENIGFMLRPQLDYSYLMQGGDAGVADIKRNVLSIRPGVFAGIEIFMEEVGIPDLNIQLGITAGSEYTSESYSSELSGVKTEYQNSSFKGPFIDSGTFGATLGLWWYF